MLAIILPSNFSWRKSITSNEIMRNATTHYVVQIITNAKLFTFFRSMIRNKYACQMVKLMQHNASLHGI